MSIPFTAPIPSAEEMPAGRIAVAAMTDVGPTRTRNEDAALLPGVILAAADRGRWAGTVQTGPRALVQVIDGMGGHGAGSLASALSALAVNESSAEYPRPGSSAEPDPAWIGAVLQGASDLVTEVGALTPATRIMGAATAGIAVGARIVQVFHVGDCRCYVLEDGYLSVLTTDHRSRGSGGLTRSLGGTGHREPVQPDIVDLDRAVTRRYLLSSDGLSDTLDFETIRSLVSADTVARAAAGLVDAAVTAGSQDNVTVIVADVPPA